MKQMGGPTVQKLLAWTADHYYRLGQSKPPDLERILLKALTTLVEEMQVVELCPEGPVLPDNLLFPWSSTGSFVWL